MGTWVGHVLPGFGFLVIGLWHLINQILLHGQSPSSFSSRVWFCVPRFKYLELYLIMVGCFASIAMELFIGPARHQPLDPDGTIPSNHLQNFEHSLVSLSLFTYAALALLFDRLSGSTRWKAHSMTLFDLTQLLAAIAFAQELSVFHFHSADHMGLEGQYHLVFQIVIAITVITSLIGIAHPGNFLNSFIRSASICFQGVWQIVTGIMLWTPKLIPKGCWMNFEVGHYVVRCESNYALHRAKAMANILFSFLVMGVTIFSVVLFITLPKIHEYVFKYRHHNLDMDMGDTSPRDKSGMSRENNCKIALLASSYSRN